MEEIAYTEQEHYLALGILCDVVRTLKEDGIPGVDFWSIAGKSGHDAAKWSDCKCSKIVHPIFTDGKGLGGE